MDGGDPGADPNKPSVRAHHSTGSCGGDLGHHSTPQVAWCPITYDQALEELEHWEEHLE